MKTLTTAGFAYLLLSKRLHASQWIALALLVCGTILVSGLHGGKNHANKDADAAAAAAAARVIGLVAVFSAALLSGFSAAYLEALLKKPAAGGLWLRNVQLGLFALPLAALAMLWQAFESSHSHRIFIAWSYRTIITLRVLVIRQPP